MLRAPAEGATFAVYHDAMALPVDPLACKSGEFGDSEAGVKKSPHNELFFVRLTSIRKAICFVLGEWFSLVLVRHSGEGLL